MQKKIKEIPEEFETYEEVAEFWETHDSTENAQKKGVSASNIASEIIEKQLARAE
jgi:hypothetical protein